MFEEFITKLQDFQSHLRKLPAGFLGDFRRDPFRIVIVGGAGVGKSGVIERIISKKSFRLPKGKDSCTRRPVVIGIPVAEKSKGFTENEVKIATREPLVLNTKEESIELIDLPGLTVMSRPDQPAEYPQTTQNLFDHHVQSADLILLCLPADVDFVNSDALRRLRQLEIDDERIVGVVSKVDLVEEPERIDLEIASTFASVVLIRNAPNLEVNESIDLVNKKEHEFFESIHVNYLTGIDALKCEILRILTRQFEKEKNNAISRLVREEKRLRDRLEFLQDPNIALTVLLNYINRVTSDLNCLESRNSRLNWIFWNMLPEAFDSIDPFEGINREQLRILLKNSQGLNASLIGIDSTFKVLTKGQLRLSENVVSECLLAVLKELRGILLVRLTDCDEVNVLDIDESIERANSISRSNSIDEFYDVRSVSDTESAFVGEGCYDFDDEIRLIPGLSKMINESISSLLSSSYEVTRKFLDEYCAMQREMIFCRDSRYLEALKQYDRTISKRARMSSAMSLASLADLEHVPMARINSESLESVDMKLPEKQGDTGFIRELLDLLFPSSGGNKMKRVEYRPRAYKPVLREDIEIVEEIDQTILCLPNEEFLLKLLEIYLNSYHRQLADFLPKCLNFHLIQRVLKGLPTALLEKRVNGDCEGIERERRKIERILKTIQEIKSI